MTERDGPMTPKAFHAVGSYPAMAQHVRMDRKRHLGARADPAKQSL
jgi:hypothetical protein